MGKKSGGVAYVVNKVYQHELNLRNEALEVWFMRGFLQYVFPLIEFSSF